MTMYYHSTVSPNCTQFKTVWPVIDARLVAEFKHSYAYLDWGLSWGQISVMKTTAWFFPDKIQPRCVLLYI